VSTNCVNKQQLRVGVQAAQEYARPGVGYPREMRLHTWTNEHLSQLILVELHGKTPLSEHRHHVCDNLCFSFKPLRISGTVVESAFQAMYRLADGYPKDRK
jgi:hypothetical protein